MRAWVIKKIPINHQLFSQKAHLHRISGDFCHSTQRALLFFVCVSVCVPSFTHFFLARSSSSLVQTESKVLYFHYRVNKQSFLAKKQKKKKKFALFRTCFLNLMLFVSVYLSRSKRSRILCMCVYVYVCEWICFWEWCMRQKWYFCIVIFYD